MEVDGTVTEERIASLVLQELRGHAYDGVTVNELCRILKECFGVVAVYCCDLIQRLKLEMDMYCLDGQHLYFVQCWADLNSARLYEFYKGLSCFEEG